MYPACVFSSVITSVAIIDRASLNLNGTVIQCRDSENSLAAYEEKTIIVLGKPNMTDFVVIFVSFMHADAAPEITGFKFTALSFTSAFIEWEVPIHCSTVFHIQISIPNHCFCENVYNSTSLTTSVDVKNLTRGVEDSVVVFSNNVHESVGNLQMTLDGKHLNTIFYDILFVCSC